MKKIRYGIIGFGAFAERAIMPAIRSSNNSELVAIQKRSLDAARLKSEEYSIPYYFDSVEALVSSSEVDAVFIVSANSQHHGEALAAAKAKKHVLVEKPMAVNCAQAKEMISACEQYAVKLMVGHMLRFSPLVRRMKEIVQSGMVGEITFIQSHFVYDANMSHRSWLMDKNAAGGGPLFDIAIHCVDTIRCILNDDTAAIVNGLLRPKHTSLAVEKTSLVSLQFSTGAMAAVFTSYESSYRQSFIELFGTKGSMSAYYFTPSNTDVTLEIKMGKEGNTDRIEKEKISVPDLYRLEIEHFSDCILRDVPPMIDIKSSLHNQEILERAMT